MLRVKAVKRRALLSAVIVTSCGGVAGQPDAVEKTAARNYPRQAIVKPRGGHSAAAKPEPILQCGAGCQVAISRLAGRCGR